MLPATSRTGQQLFAYFKQRITKQQPQITMIQSFIILLSTQRKSCGFSQAAGFTNQTSIFCDDNVWLYVPSEGMSENLPHQPSRDLGGITVVMAQIERKA